MPIPKILVLPGSTRAGSHNVKLAALAAKQLMLLDVDMTRISLADYPLPIYDADIDVRAGPAQQCFQAQTDDHGAPRCIHCKPRIQRLGHADSQECPSTGYRGYAGAMIRLMLHSRGACSRSHRLLRDGPAACDR